LLRWYDSAQRPPPTPPSPASEVEQQQTETEKERQLDDWKGWVGAWSRIIRLQESLALYKEMKNFGFFRVLLSRFHNFAKH